MLMTTTPEQPVFPAPENQLPDFSRWPVTVDGIPDAERLDEPAEVAAYNPSAQAAEHIVAVDNSYEPPRGFADRLRGLWVGMQVGQMARNWNLEKRWYDMSRHQRAMARLATGTTVAIAGMIALIVGRSSGAAAHGLEETGILQLPDLPSAPSFQSPSYLENVGTQLTLVADKTMELVSANDYDDQIDLKLDPNARPEPVPLGKWDKATGHGTIWNQVVEYADEMGYGDLTEQQKRPLVQETLDHNHRTWQQATELSSTYKPELLTRNEMQEILSETGARQTHAADLPVADLPRRTDTDRDLPPVPGTTLPGDTGTQAQPPGPRTNVDPYSEVPKFPWVDWLPRDNLNPRDPDWVIDNWLVRTRIDDELGEVLIGAGIAGAVAYGAHQRNRRRRAERRLAVYDRQRVIVDRDDDGVPDEEVVVEEPRRAAVADPPIAERVTPVRTVRRRWRRPRWNYRRRRPV